ncbi:hypothetical protein [Kriegella aquimaris]|uniref:N-sulphoglucosamine sulphohydrolase C-terminal domain-containing protein n=1 Tax=Kriegella aquimaris TaxID=192904 RepID=A0A1G9S3Y7_9FLAO|nr:hypothetical protein [Kriegella aquimaris]SDM30017.1 hypothetical protein SAMN04488514_10791 [Kriegella aquimaris]
MEGPLQGEPAVYEELFDLKNDPEETTNLAMGDTNTQMLEKMRTVWKKEIKNARGSDAPQVLRYTSDSESERGMIIDPK